MKRAFYDRATGVLKAHGYALANDPDDVVRDVHDAFDLEPRRWRWNGTDHEPVGPSINERIVALENSNRITERSLREWFLQDVVDRGYIEESILDPNTPLDTSSATFQAYPIMLRRAIVAERGIRALRAQR